MGDTFRRVRDGERLKIPARTYNAMIDAAQDYANRKNARTDSDASGVLPVNLVYIKNSSGINVDRLNILGISNTLIDPASNNFKQSAILDGVTPVIAGHGGGRFVVTAEPIKDGAVGRACITGYFPIQIDVANESHTYADVNDNIVTSLKSVETGPAVILWKESGIGVKWALVRFGGSGGGSASVRRAKVISAPKAPDFNAASGTTEYYGDAFYTLRDVGETLTIWHALDPGQDVFGIDSVRVYPNANSPSYLALSEISGSDVTVAPPDLPDKWQKRQEIKVEFAEGFENIQGFDIRDCSPLVMIGHEVEYTSKEIPNVGTRYFIVSPSIQWKGDKNNSTIRNRKDPQGRTHEIATFR